MLEVAKVINALDFLKMLSETLQGRTQAPSYMPLEWNFLHDLQSVPKCVKFLVLCVLHSRYPK